MCIIVPCVACCVVEKLSAKCHHLLQCSVYNAHNYQWLCFKTWCANACDVDAGWAQRLCTKSAFSA